MRKSSNTISRECLTPESDDESERMVPDTFKSRLQQYAFNPASSTSPLGEALSSKKHEVAHDLSSAADVDADINYKEYTTVPTKRKRSTSHSPSRLIHGTYNQHPGRKLLLKQPRPAPSVSRKPPPLAIENKLIDSLRPNLILVMIGVNPGRTTALTGHAYSHKSNRYWPTMYAAGVTPVLHPASDTALLQELYGIGHTNLVSRPTVTESDIHHHEFMEGAEILDAKIRLHKPTACAVVGKGIWMRWLEWKTGQKGSSLDKRFRYGWQDEHLWIGRTIDNDGRVTWQGARTIVVATTSGAAAQFAANRGEKRVELWKPLGEWFQPRREEWIRDHAN